MSQQRVFTCQIDIIYIFNLSTEFFSNIVVRKEFPSGLIKFYLILVNNK